MPTKYAGNEVLSEFGLVFVADLDSKVERFSVNVTRLRQIPFFDALDRFMKDFFMRNGVTDQQISYVIWGGLAANLMINLLGKSGTYYSLHDIELFLLKGGKIYQPEGLSEALRKDFSSNEYFHLEVGGQAIIKALEGVSVEDFQKQRIHRNDGDLYLNNLILIVDQREVRVLVDAPSGTLQELLAGGIALKMKDVSDLRHINQLARRIYRNISKSLRFQQVAGLTLTAETKHQIESLIDSYSNKLEGYFSSSGMSPEEKAVTAEWLANAEIVNVESGKRWLLLKTLSETAKRTAGLQGLSSLDKIGFYRFFLGDAAHANNLFEHPWIHMVQDSLTDPAWPSAIATRRDLAQQCWLDFVQYQKPGAENLCEIYSLNLTR